ncbi:uncharacterized protein LOC119114484 [Pollicipes pollicipes]|uniref:uncharacterized protein LOC119114484 n=1 Tax=Pollicipes pollicipes TaxID=41117 RepID=UPI0018856FAB|nr:uncharacterized protein LOC119114484 [Pollicipes pollicipes]
MKAIFCIVLALSAAVAANGGFYPFSVQRAPDAFDNYNRNHYKTAKHSGLLDRLFGANRRQGILEGLGGIGGPVAVVGGSLVAGIHSPTGLAVVIANINSSGRGLDTDGLEDSQSVWMDQLVRDFEDSWQTTE